ncbi:MAG: TetR/AcrR family transcriptional regulator [Chloroflexi bacterium]|nr:TetR/AcrR family transcriptional regulator [Chloroflexota bacterium]
MHPQELQRVLEAKIYLVVMVWVKWWLEGLRLARLRKMGLWYNHTDRSECFCIASEAKKPMTPRQARSQATYHRLLQAAEEAFAQSSYDAVSVAEICQRAGVSKGAFYHHFPSKQAIFLAVLQAWVQRLENGLRTALAAAPDVETALDAMVTTFIQALQDTRERIPLLLAFWHQAAHDPKVWPQVAEPFRRFEALLTDYLANIGCPNPSIRARALVAFATGVLLRTVLQAPGPEDPAMIRMGLRCLLSSDTTSSILETKT